MSPGAHDEPAHPSALEDVAAPDTREQYRQQFIESLGGWSGTVVAAIPTVVFVVVNAAASLGWAVLSAVAAGLALTGYRLARHRPVQQAIYGLLGVAGAALIAAWTGQARGYFLLGIWTSFAYAAVFAVSALVRRPLVGVAWEFLDPTDGLSDAWYRSRPLLSAYDLATAAATLVFLARGLVQNALFDRNATGWLAVARLAMGYPLTIAAVGFALLVVRRARRRITAG